MGPNGSISRIPRAFRQWKVGLTIDKADIPFWKTATREMRQAAVGAIAPELGSLDLELGGFYPVTLLNTHRWTAGNTVLVGDACHAMHPARGQGMNVAIRCIDKLVGVLPPPERMQDPSHVADALDSYEQATKPAIDAALAENHALAASRDDLSLNALARSIGHLRAIQADPERRRRHCLAAAGYGDART
jgi:2-polyprenyl-6-methoxyphenol hydroxylase-like FAD-dependent oxidoreductase